MLWNDVLQLQKNKIVGSWTDCCSTMQKSHLEKLQTSNAGQKSKRVSNVTISRDFLEEGGDNFKYGKVGLQGGVFRVEAQAAGWPWVPWLVGGREVWSFAHGGWIAAYGNPILTLTYSLKLVVWLITLMVWKCSKTYKRGLIAWQTLKSWRALHHPSCCHDATHTQQISICMSEHKLEPPLNTFRVSCNPELNPLSTCSSTVCISQQIQIKSCDNSGNNYLINILGYELSTLLHNIWLCIQGLACFNHWRPETVMHFRQRPYHGLKLELH